MAINRRKAGARAEEVAASYLRAYGYIIEAVNWRKKSYEIDIIARKGNCLVFVEVKSSRSDKYGPPEIRVTKTKQRRIAAAALEYLSLIESAPEELRFDVVAITWPRGKAPAIEHLQSAFTADFD